MLKPSIDITIPVMGLERVVFAGIGRVVSYSIKIAGIITEHIASVEAEIQVDGRPGRGVYGCSKNDISADFQ